MALVIVVGLVAWPDQAAGACRILTVDDAFERADVIFSGRVTSTDDPNKEPPWFSTVKVEQVWKGDVAPIAQVSVDGTERIPFESGVDYLVYGIHEPDTIRIHTDACTGTGRLDESSVYLEHLNRTVPKRQPWVAIGIALLLLAGITLVIRAPRMTRIGPPASS
ncbi:MAG: hypothetical protein M9890_04800 [Thermomicrobiales bacterium]|nr:hypothetical protein [Thermomicrobiales bacterium]